MMVPTSNLMGFHCTHMYFCTITCIFAHLVLVALMTSNLTGFRCTHIYFCTICFSHIDLDNVYTYLLIRLCQHRFCVSIGTGTTDCSLGVATSTDGYSSGVSTSTSNGRSRNTTSPDNGGSCMTTSANECSSQPPLVLTVVGLSHHLYKQL